ncbi:MAG TPA: NUDIX hydrolase [Acidobacteriota bacterium]|nr:NUDIX hydrolase [Acidobacteriota bacterium]
MYIPSTAISEWENRYGTPLLWSYSQPADGDEFAVIAGSQKHGRAHDITLYIERAGRIAVMAKPFYPPDLYRAPSGGLNPGESLEAGAAREAREETGLAISLQKYILRAHVLFTWGERTIDWTTHVFRAITDEETIAPTDSREIREARWAEPDEFAFLCNLMRQTGSSGLNYRAALHEQIATLHPLFAS